MKIYLVGGAVRDQLLGVPVTERDWVVVGATVQDMLALGYRQVGKDFPVFLHPETNEEYALARLERKVQPGYKGFEFDTSPQVTLEDDLRRRDLTINAMAQSLEGELIDPYQGQRDLKEKMLRHVSSAFNEDPVRILRVGRFLARYSHLGFQIAPETIKLMQTMVAAHEVDALVAERVWKELERALFEPHPEQFFYALHTAHALEVLFPHLQAYGPGLSALTYVATVTPTHPAAAAIRFATVLHAQAEDHPSLDTKQIIIELCQRYRVPTAYKELAILVALHHTDALKAQDMTAAALLNLLSSVDSFRREERFHYFLIACQAIAQIKEQKFNPEWLIRCAKAAQAVDIKALLANGLTGEALVTEIKNQRLIALDQWLKK